VESVGKYTVIHGGSEPVCVPCVNAYIEHRQQERERWKPL
jgi:hypothetical protein